MIFPDSFLGVSGEQAYERILAKPDTLPPSPPKGDKKTKVTNLDRIAAENGANKNYGNWKDYWKNIPDKDMAEISDLYLLGKSNDTATIQSTQEDFKTWVCSGPYFEYNKKNLEARITHYKDSKRKEKNMNVYVPDYSNGELIEKVLSTTKGYDFIKALLNTNDDKETIMQSLEKLSGKNRNNIKIWTPAQESRKNTPSRVAFLLYLHDNFHILCDLNLIHFGRSRGVRYQ